MTGFLSLGRIATTHYRPFLTDKRTRTSISWHYLGKINVSKGLLSKALNPSESASLGSGACAHRKPVRIDEIRKKARQLLKRETQSFKRLRAKADQGTQPSSGLL
jgi:hypothetical protein